MKRANFRDCFNDNAMDVTINEQYVTFFSEDLDKDELTEININKEDVKRLIQHLNKAV